jgi:hypothetical protein
MFQGISRGRRYMPTIRPTVSDNNERFIMKTYIKYLA